MDSGATNHISHHKSSFSTFKPLSNTAVTLPNDILVSIVGIGTIHLDSSLILLDVLYISQFKFNLLSVSSSTKTMGCRIWFDETYCGIQDPTQGLIIGMGRQVVNLYFLDIESLSFPGNKIHPSMYKIHHA